MNVYLRNWVICLITNAIVFLIGWGCIVPDQTLDNTHLFGLIGNVEIVRGNTAVVFGMCCISSTLIMIAGIIEALIEDYRRPCFNQATRAEKPRKAPKPQISGMRIADPACPEKSVDEDPKTPTLD